MTQWHALNREPEKIYEICYYRLVVQELVDENECNTASPLPVTVTRIEPLATHLVLETDQSGLIGLIRYLHQQGIVLLSLSRSHITAKKE